MEQKEHVKMWKRKKIWVFGTVASAALMSVVGGVCLDNNVVSASSITDTVLKNTNNMKDSDGVTMLTDNARLMSKIDKTLEKKEHASQFRKTMISSDGLIPPFDENAYNNAENKGVIGTAKWYIDKATKTMHIGPGEYTQNELAPYEQSIDIASITKDLDVDNLIIDGKFTLNGIANQQFLNMYNIKNADLRNLNLGNLTKIFINGGERLSNLNVEGIDTSRLQYFEIRSKVIEKIDISSWNLSSLTKLGDVNDGGAAGIGTFSGDLKLKELLLPPHFLNKNITDISYLFGSCLSLQNVDIDDWDTSNVKYWDGAFSQTFNINLSNPSKLNFSKMDTTRVSQEPAFRATKIEYLDLSSLNLSSSDSDENVDRLFFYGPNVVGQDLSNNELRKAIYDNYIDEWNSGKWKNNIGNSYFDTLIPNPSNITKDELFNKYYAQMYGVSTFIKKITVPKYVASNAKVNFYMPIPPVGYQWVKTEGKDSNKPAKPLTILKDVGLTEPEQYGSTYILKPESSANSYPVHIHKQQGSKDQVNQVSGDRNDGLEHDLGISKELNNNGTPLDGIKFTATEIKPTGKVSEMDASNPATFTKDTEILATKPVDRESSEVIDPATGEIKGYKSVKSTSAITDIDGLADFDLEKGYYLIHEEKQSGIDSIDDFILSLPMADKNGNKLDEINIYPKNHIQEDETKLNMKKEISAINGNPITNSFSEKVEIGSTITYSLSAHVPATIYNANGDNKYGKFTISDPIVDNLSYVKDSAKLYTIDNTTGKETLVPTDEYTVNVGDFVGKDNTPNSHKYQTINAALTDKGIEHLAGKNVILKLDTTIDKLSKDNNGDPAIIKNIFNVFADNVQKNIPDIPGTTDPNRPDIKPGEDGKTIDPTDPTNPVTPTDPYTPDSGDASIEIGRIDLKKVDTDDNSVVLNGAEFTLYKDKETKNSVKMSDINKKYEGTFKDGLKDSDNVILVTGKDGIAHLDGMKPGTKYYAKETKAPKGYLLTDEIFEITGNMDKTIDATVENATDSFSSKLPITGSQLRIILMTVGTFMIISTGTALYIRRKQEFEK